MREDNNTPAGAPWRARFPRRRAGSAAERLTGLITIEEYNRLFAAEAAAWAEIMAADEAALDAELGSEEVAAINALDSGRAGAVGERPNLRLVEAEDVNISPVAYRDHYRLRLAGVDGGLMASASEMDAEVREIRRLLMASGGGFPPDVVHKLDRYVYEGQILVAERLVHGTATIVGCVAYEALDLFCPAGRGRDFIKQRVNVIRLVCVSPPARRASLAMRLCLEAQLRGTVRALFDNGPQCIGTAGLILEANARAIAWAERLKHRVRVLGSKTKVVAKDPTLTALRDHVERSGEARVRRTPYRFIVANRTQLFEAARYHLRGIDTVAARSDPSGSRIDYDRDDPCSIAVLRVASAIDSRDVATLGRLGLIGEPDATVWGPPTTQAMSVPVGNSRNAPEKRRAGAGI